MQLSALSQPPAANPYAPGLRVLVRDAEWLIRRVDRTSNGHYALTVMGLSELVRDREAIFLTDLERRIELLRPEDTEFVADPSPQYTDSRLYIEARLRQQPPTLDGLDSRLQLGHRAAMDVLPFQLEPALLALDQPRQRILIADTVGLGKTLEAGILLSELIARGRGKRILVVTVKSMLAQFQQELWNRFAIPLVRLDSVGLARVRAQLPTNQNPFYYYDRTIISIDTLKQDREYRVYLEQAHWDIIVIDEAHHVAERAGRVASKREKGSLRHQLAGLLAARSDTLLMLSATPHDGRARSFASLMNMLDPTAIADPDHYTKDDIKGLFIRRFKKDVADQLVQAMQPRQMARVKAPSTGPEEAAFAALLELQALLNKQPGGQRLFGTTLEKAMFSSPAACLATVRQRLRRLEAGEVSSADATAEAAALRALEAALLAVEPDHVGKLNRLVRLVREDLGWTGADATDRLVVFTERIETLKFLAAELPARLGLTAAQVAILHGGMPDTEQQEVVEAFGQQQRPVRLLIASDVASEGINLHYMCHRMIHFDVPWSLMVFQQRNGRIDRYGQAHVPEIYYMMVDSTASQIAGDVRILDLLVEKDHQASANIGDPSALMGVYDIEAEEAITADAMAAHETAEAFGQRLNPEAFDPLEAMLRLTEPADTPVDPRTRVAARTSLFPTERAYVEAALHALRARGAAIELKTQAQTLAFTMPDDLQDRFAQCPKEVLPHPKPLVLTDEVPVMKAAIAASRASESAWPEVQWLWPLHPAVGWLNDKLAAFYERPRSLRADAARHRAPVLRVGQGLGPGEALVLMVGVWPNRKGQPLIQSWLGVCLRPGAPAEVWDWDTVLSRTGLATAALPNSDTTLPPEEATGYRGLLPAAITAARTHMGQARAHFDQRVDAKLEAQLEALGHLRNRQVEQLRLNLDKKQLNTDKRQEQQAAGERRIDKIFSEHRTWVEDTLRTGDDPSLQVMALLVARA